MTDETSEEFYHKRQWKKSRVCSIVDFTVFLFFGIIRAVEIYRSVLCHGKTVACPPARCGKEACVYAPRGKAFSGEVIHITSVIVAVVGVLGSLASIASLVLYLCDKHDKKK